MLVLFVLVNVVSTGSLLSELLNNNTCGSQTSLSLRFKSS